MKYFKILILSTLIILLLISITALLTLTVTFVLDNCNILNGYKNEIDVERKENISLREEIIRLEKSLKFLQENKGNKGFIYRHIL